MRWVIPTVAGICLAADLASKSWVRANLAGGTSAPLIPGILRLTHTTNSGAAFGVGREAGPFMTLIALGILGTVLFWVVKKERSAQPPALYERIGMGFLVGGAIGNIWDRLGSGRVTDFLELTFIDFPVFNLADVCIDVGAVLILLKIFERSTVCALARSAELAHNKNGEDSPRSEPLQKTESSNDSE